MTKKSAEAPLTISAELARSLLAYDAETGAFVWRVDRGGKTKAGTAAGHGHNQGYRGIRLYGKAFEAEAVAARKAAKSNFHTFAKEDRA